MQMLFNISTVNMYTTGGAVSSVNRPQPVQTAAPVPTSSAPAVSKHLCGEEMLCYCYMLWCRTACYQK